MQATVGRAPAGRWYRPWQGWGPCPARAPVGEVRATQSRSMAAMAAVKVGAASSCATLVRDWDAPSDRRPSIGGSLLLVARRLAGCAASAGVTADAASTTTSTIDHHVDVDHHRARTTTTTTAAHDHHRARRARRGDHHATAVAPGHRAAAGAALRRIDQDGDGRRPLRLVAARAARCPCRSCAPSTSRHFGNDGAVHTGRLIVAADLADAMVAIFRDLYDARFPIQRMEPIDVYGGDDNALDQGQQHERLQLPGGHRRHRLVRARLRARHRRQPVREPVREGQHGAATRGGAVHGPKLATTPGMIHAGDAVVDAFAARGWSWGGYWSLAEGLPALLDDRSVAGRGLAACAGEAAVDGEQLAGDVAGARR